MNVAAKSWSAAIVTAGLVGDRLLIDPADENREVDSKKVFCYAEGGWG